MLEHYKLIGILLLIILGLIIVVIFLIGLYLKKDKAYEITKFSLTNKEIGFIIELNKEKKVEFLVLENNSLRAQIKALETKNKKERWTSIGLILILYLILLLDKLKLKEDKEN